jgi:hypothetical protein
MNQLGIQGQKWQVDVQQGILQGYILLVLLLGCC